MKVVLPECCDYPIIISRAFPNENKWQVYCDNCQHGVMVIEMTPNSPAK